MNVGNQPLSKASRYPDNALGLVGAVLVLMGLALLVGFAVTGARYVEESNQLREAALEALGPTPGDKAQVLQRLNHWVYMNQGHAKNRSYFLGPQLGPTPVQVLGSGGDCSDKSRLLAAMLYQVGIPSTLVMLYSPEFGRPTHTVVETRLPDFRAVADPSYDLVFPDGAGRLMGALDLKERHDLFLARLRTLAWERGPRSKVAYYKRDLESYRWPRTINWERMAATKLVGNVLGLVIPEPALMTRPRILAEPVLLVAVALLVGGTLTVALGLMLVRLRCR